jgi:hypothetical protein
MLYRYVSIILASALLLVGLQVPGFIDQYTQRVSAHLIEVKRNLSGFQTIADLHHGGSLERLIEKHRQSTDATFYAEGDVIADLYARYTYLNAELAQLDTSLPRRIRYILLDADRELLRETADHYTYTIDLTWDAAVCGAFVLVFGIVLFDLLALLAAALMRRIFGRHSAHQAR